MPPTSFFASLSSAQHRHYHRFTISNARQRNYRDTVALNSAPDGMHWFVKTEKFCKPFPEVKLHLEAHRAWVRALREQSSNEQRTVSSVSGYRVDENDKPGGGGLMIFECVDWQLNKWIAETGDISIE